MNWLPKILTGLLNSIIVFTMVMLPNAYHLGSANVGIVYAAEDTPDSVTNELTNTLTSDCVTGENDHSENYYKKGCAFEASQIDMQEWGGNWDEAEVINYIFLLVMSMAIIATLDNQIPTISKNDCPANEASTITINLLRGAAGVHIIQEILTSAMYKDAAKKAAQTYIDGSKTDENEEAQLEAFNQLISMYEEMKAITIAKTTLHAILEAAYLAAFGIEIGTMVACGSTCGANQAAAKAAWTGSLAAMSTASAAVTAAVQAAQSSVYPATVAMAAACQPFVVAMGTDLAFHQSLTAQLEGRGVARTADVQARTLTDNAQVPVKLAELLSPAMAARAVPGASEAQESQNRSALDTALNAESIQNRTAQAAIEASLRTIDTYTGTLSGAAAACTSLQVVQVYLQSRTPAKTALEMPVLCCGAIPGGDSTKYISGAPVNSQVPGVYDNANSASGSAYVKPPFSPELNPLNSDNMKIVKSLVYNGMMSFYVQNKMRHNPNDPRVNLVEYAKYHKRAEALLNANPANLLEKPLTTNEVYLSMQNEMGLPKSEETKYIAGFISNLTSQLFIPSAFAVGIDGESLGIQLGLAVGVLIIAFIIKADLQYYLLSTPTRRSILYAAMAALGGVQLGFDGAAIDRIEKYLIATKEEKKRFLDSATLNADLVTGDPNGGGGTTSDLVKIDPTSLMAQDTLSCEASTATTSAPPSEIRKGEAVATACLVRAKLDINNPIPTQRELAASSGGFDFNAAKPLNPVLNTLANSAAPGHDGIQGGDFKGVANQVSSAMKARNKKILEKYDSMFSKKNKKGKKSQGLSDAISGVVASIGQNANANLTAATAAIPGLPGANTGSGKDEKGIKKTPFFGVPQAVIPGGAPVETEAFSFGDDDSKTSPDGPRHGLRAKEEKSLADFEINYNDVAKNSGASIFKLLSNRYILQYPKLLEEIKSRRQDLPMVKNEKVEPVTEKGKLKKLLNESK